MGQKYEEFDGELIAYYRAKFNSVRFVMDRDWAVEHTQMGKLPVVLVACSVGKPVFDDDKDGDRYREVTLKVEEVVPLEGELKRQAMIYMAHMGEDGVIDFPTNPDSQKLQQAIRQQDRLAEYIAKEWGGQIEDHETPVEAAIRLLEEGRTAVAALLSPDVPDDEAELEASDRLEEVVALAPPAPVKSVVPPIPPEEEMGVKTRRVKTAAFDPEDVDGFEVHHDPSTTPGVERVGSVYGDRHSGETQEILEKAFS
jgi:hypothetical protein